MMKKEEEKNKNIVAFSFIIRNNENLYELANGKIGKRCEKSYNIYYIVLLNILKNKITNKLDENSIYGLYSLNEIYFLVKDIKGLKLIFLNRKFKQIVKNNEIFQVIFKVLENKNPPKKENLL